jgi:glycosyltransferase involved in cell wall biosynthesis
MGTPAIATDLGAPPETMLPAPTVPLNHATGWIVPPGDAVALAAALATALSLPLADRLAMGQRARRRTLQLFSLTEMKRQTLQVYDRLLQTQLTPTFDAAPGIDVSPRRLLSPTYAANPPATHNNP